MSIESPSFLAQGTPRLGGGAPVGRPSSRPRATAQLGIPPRVSAFGLLRQDGTVTGSGSGLKVGMKVGTSALDGRNPA